MTVIQETLVLPGLGSGSPSPAEVRIRLAGAQGRPVLGVRVSDGSAIAGELLLNQQNGGINENGVWSANLTPNSDISPAGTTYLITRKVPGCGMPFSSYVSVPVTGGPYEAFTREDDVLGEVTPSALSGHAADLALHGGGVLLDSAYIDTNVVVTGSGGGFFTQFVPGLLVTVPDIAAPVMLWGHIPALQQPGGPAEGSFGIYPSTNNGIFAALDGVPVPDMDTTTARTVDPRAVLPAHSPGDYVIGGLGASGNLTIKVAATTLGHATLWAVRM